MDHSWDLRWQACCFRSGSVGHAHQRNMEWGYQLEDMAESSKESPNSSSVNLLCTSFSHYVRRQQAWSVVMSKRMGSSAFPGLSHSQTCFSLSPLGLDSEGGKCREGRVWYERVDHTLHNHLSCNPSCKFGKRNLYQINDWKLKINRTES